MTGRGGHGPVALVMAAVSALVALTLFALVAVQAHGRLAASGAMVSAAEEKRAVTSVRRARLALVAGAAEDPLERYRDLVAEGVISAATDSRRVDALYSAAAALGLPALRYRIGEESISDTTNDRMTLRRVPMELEFTAAHEGVVPELLGRLANSGEGRAVPRRCLLRRKGAPEGGDGFPGVDVRCGVDWYGIESRSDPA